MSFVPVSITFDINTADNLRRIDLTLTSAQHNGGSETWKINFQVWERADHQEDFQVIGDVSVELDPEDFPGARTIVSERQLCTGQRAQALLAADTLKANLRGEVDFQDVQDDVAQIVRAE